MRNRPDQDLPDGLRVLVAGGHKVEKDSVLTFCRELGKALIRSKTNGTKVVVMTGGRGDERAADREVVLGAREALDEASEERLVRRVVTFPRPTGPPSRRHSSGRTCKTPGHPAGPTVHDGDHSRCRGNG
jgi:hypothetical protein